MFKAFMKYLFTLLCYLFGVCMMPTTNLHIAPINNSNSISLTIPPARIVNGYRCPIADHPYMIKILYTGSFIHRCGGTLLSDFWILTAAHCCDETYKRGTFTALAGSTSITRIGEQKHLIIRNYMHPNYNNISLRNDIALMELDYPITQTEYVKYVQLPHAFRDDIPIEDVCKTSIVIGWGDQYLKDTTGAPLSTPIPPFDKHLQCVKLPVITKQECEDKYGYLIEEAVMCTFAERKDSCQGDSGGPLMCNGVQYGIVSWGLGCGYKYPGVYTRVDMYINFIRKVVRRSSGLSHSYKRVNFLISLLNLILVLY